MDCTGRWTEEILIRRMTTRNCQKTCFTGHDPFGESQSANVPPTGGAHQDWSLSVRIYYREVFRTRVWLGAREAENEDRSTSPIKKNGKAVGQSAEQEILREGRTSLRYCRHVGRHGRQAHVEKEKNGRRGVHRNRYVLCCSTRDS